MQVIERGKTYYTDDGQIISFVTGGQRGTTNEELLAIVLDRIELQQSQVLSRKATMAANSIREALYRLGEREAQRVRDGLLGSDVSEHAARG